MSEFEIYDTEPRRQYPTEGGENQPYSDGVEAMVAADRATCLFSPSHGIVLHRLDAIHRRPGRAARKQIYYAIASGSGGKKVLDNLASEVNRLFSGGQEWESVKEADERLVTADEVSALVEYSCGFENEASLEREIGKFLQDGGSGITVVVPSRKAAHETLCQYANCGACILVTRDAAETADHFPTDLVIEYGAADSLELASEKSSQKLESWRQNQRQQELGKTADSIENRFHAFFNDDTVDDYTRVRVLSDILGTDSAVPKAEDYDTKPRKFLESIESHLENVHPENERELQQRIEQTAEDRIDDFRRSVRSESAEQVRSTVANETERIESVFDEPSPEVRQQILEDGVAEYARPNKTIKGHRVPWPVWNGPDLLAGALVGGILMVIIFVSMTYFGVSLSIPLPV